MSQRLAWFLVVTLTLGISATCQTTAGSSELSPKILVGRWKCDLPDRSGSKKAGTFDLSMPDVQPMSAGTTQLYLNVIFADDCPMPFSAARGQIMFAASGPDFTAGPKDSGTAMIIASGVNALMGTYRLTGADAFVLKLQNGAEIDAKRVDGSKPLASATNSIFPADAAWPMKGVPAMTKRALEYVRAHWQPDAALTQVELSPDDSPAAALTSAVTAKLDFYSASTGSVLFMTLGPGAFNMLPAKAGDARYDVLPDTFADLPDVIENARRQSLVAGQIAKATLQFLVRRNLPDGTSRTVPKTGPYWTLVSDLDPDMDTYPQVWGGAVTICCCPLAAFGSSRPLYNAGMQFSIRSLAICTLSIAGAIALGKNSERYSAHMHPIYSYRYLLRWSVACSAAL